MLYNDRQKLVVYESYERDFSLYKHKNYRIKVDLFIDIMNKHSTLRLYTFNETCSWMRIGQLS
jgi:hypothetical protein